MFLWGLAIMGVHKKVNPQFFQQGSKMIRSKQQDCIDVPLSQPHFEANVRMRLGIPKVGIWSSLGLPKF
jgi:hypothetical protein